MAERLATSGLAVGTFALGRFASSYEIREITGIQEALDAARALILPMPAFDERGYVAHPFAACEEMEASELFGRIGGRIPVFGGRVSARIFALAADCGVNISDYAVSDEVQIRNAVPTAEGAIALAMGALDVTLHGARAAVLGYGRVGYALASRLRALGAQVSVAVRKARDMARVACAGCCARSLGDADLTKALCEGAFDVVFNTIPVPLISDEVLGRIPPCTVMIELASAPGGWSPKAEHVCRTIYAPGLPGICAPRTAGIILADGLLRVLEEVMGQ
jgi:dipicolinate synthase subunit A